MKVFNMLDSQAAALSYYEACFKGQRPEWVPAIVNVRRDVRSDVPTHHAAASQGEKAAVCNVWGAVSVKHDDGSLLGLRPDEFEVVSWRKVERDEMYVGVRESYGHVTHGG